MLNIENQVIAITGASSGIGKASAKLLAQHVAKVVLGARRTDRLEAIISKIQAQGGSAVYYTLDVTSLEAMQAFVKFAKDQFGRLNVMINNAGLMPLSRLDVLKIDEWNHMIEMNAITNKVALVTGARYAFRTTNTNRCTTDHRRLVTRACGSHRQHPLRTNLGATRSVKARSQSRDRDHANRSES
ncbi:MAG: SDR family NAD(P)-dependent oxidoreductase [Nostoc sp.]|uniref:SDR family oxidoreductase n=1 Tax=Nostoc sp. TaxID=1180 RepID=UPI002FFC6FA7